MAMAEQRRIQLTCVSGNIPVHSSSLGKISITEEQLTSVSGNIPLHSSLGKISITEEPTGTVSTNPVPENKEVSEKSGATARIVLSLFEPNQWRCPEFYYPELVNKNNSTKKSFKSLEEVEEEKQREDTEALAKKFEEKYGGKKHKKDRMQDLVDMGYGYDDTDSFIDNSEAYDELVPASLTTKYGGFYINSGVLHFRQASDSESDGFSVEMKKLKAPMKRKLMDGGDVKLIKKAKNGQHKKCKVSQTGVMPLNSLEEKKKKKKRSGGQSVGEMLKRFSREKESSLKEPQPLPSSQHATLPAPETDCGPNAADPLLSLIGSANESDLLQAASTIDFDIDLDRLLDESPEPSTPEPSPPEPSSLGPSPPELSTPEPSPPQPSPPQPSPPEPSPPEPSPQEPSPPQPSPPQPSPPGLDENSDPQSAVQPPKQPLPLPEGLPAAMERRIKDLTQAAKASEGEGKLKFFTQDINNILLDIELQSRELNSQMRSGVYAHLASFLPCSKDTLVKRARKLHLNEQDGRLKEPLQRLKEAVGRSMPEQMNKYQDECQAHTQAKFAKMLEEGKEKEQKDKVYSEDEEEKSGRRVMGPRKKFQWNEEVREFLCSVVRLKMGSYQLERNKFQNAEEYLKAFLEAEVKPAWPKGLDWLLIERKPQIPADTAAPPGLEFDTPDFAPLTEALGISLHLRTDTLLTLTLQILFKESRRAHCHITCLPTKKKVLTAPKIKNKEPLAKLERKVTSLGTAPGPTGSSYAFVPVSGSLSVLASSSETSPARPHAPGAHHCAPPPVSDSAQAFGTGDSLDGDLIHNPPSLRSVSEELAALSSNVRACPDFSFSSVHKSGPDPVPTVPSHKERNSAPKPSETPLISSKAPSQSPLERALSLEQLSQDGKTENSQLLVLPGYKELLAQATLSTSHSHLPSPTLKPFPLHSQHQKCSPTPVQFSSASSQNKTLKFFPPCPGKRQPKVLSKALAFHSLSSAPPNNGHPASISVANMIPSRGSSQSYLLKCGSTSGTPSLPFQPVFTLSGAPKGSIAPSISGSLSSVTSVIASHTSPSLSPPSPGLTVKKAPSQTLTLVAPPGGSNGDSAAGTQGVARLLTSSLDRAVAPPVAPPVSAPAAAVPKSSAGASVLSTSPTLNLPSPSLIAVDQKLTPGTQGILPGIVPMHTYSFPVIFDPESASQKSGSKDAVVTGPAPGTFHHGLAHRIFGGLHSCSLHPPQLLQPTLSSHLQLSLKDGNQVHGESSDAELQ